MTDAGLFEYTEPTLRSAVVIAMAAEAAAVVLLLAYLATQRRAARRRVRTGPNPPVPRDDRTPTRRRMIRERPPAALVGEPSSYT